jgi:hypothetical protein
MSTVIEAENASGAAESEGGPQERRRTPEQPRLRTLPPVSWVFAALPIVMTIGGGYAAHDFLHHSFSKAPELNGLIGSVFLIGLIALITRLFSIAKESKSFDWQLGQLKGVERRALPPKLMRTEVYQLFERLRAHGLKAGAHLPAEAIEAEVEGLEHVIERRYELGQFLVGALVALGLLGTFIGLLETLIATADLIGSIADSDGGGDIEEQFKGIVRGLKPPLEAMGTAFSASMFGLVGSIMLGLELVTIRSAATRLIEGVRTGLLRAVSVEAHRPAVSAEEEAAAPKVSEEALASFVDFVRRHEERSRTLLNSVAETAAKGLPLMQAMGEQLEAVESRLAEAEGAARAADGRLADLAGEMKAMAMVLARQGGEMAVVSERLAAQAHHAAALDRLAGQFEGLSAAVRSDQGALGELGGAVRGLQAALLEQSSAQSGLAAEQLATLRAISTLNERALRGNAESQVALSKVAAGVGVLAERVQTIEKRDLRGS